MKPIIDMRVIQTIDWAKDATNGWIKIPIGYEIQILREGETEWTSLNVIVNEISNPQKEADDAATSSE